MKLGIMTLLFPIASLICSLYSGYSASELTTPQLLTKIKSQLEVREGTGSIFSLEDVKWLLKRLRMKDCKNRTHTTEKCNLCITPNEFFKWYNYRETMNITKKVLAEYSLGIIYILTKRDTMEKNCEDFIRKVLNTKASSISGILLQKYRESPKLMVQNVERLYGDQLRRKCFDISSMAEKINSMVATGADAATSTSLYMIAKLLDCLPHVPSDDKTSVKKIFNTFQKVYSNVVLSNFADDDRNTTTCYKRADIENILLGNYDGPMINEKMINEVTPVVLELVRGMSVMELDEEHEKDKEHNEEQLEEEEHNEEHIEDKEHNEEHEDHKDQEEDEKHQQQHNNGHRHKQKKRERNTDKWEAWIASIISISVLSFGSLIGIVAFSGKKGKYFNHVMSFLVSLGSSVLVCDALLHLFPHSLGFHGHADGSHFKIDSWLWKCVMIIIGVYIFIMMELTLSVFGLNHNHSHGNQHNSNNECHNDEEIRRLTGGSVEVFHKDSTTFSINSITPVAWIILLGDGVHNFMDGVVIGGVFSEPFPVGLNGGIMTSIAILIHEIPHELGDFAVLISSGLSIKQALILNLLSSLTAFVGGVVGILLGTQWDASSWIFSLTAGLFIYISLVDMLPEVHANPLLKRSPKLALFLDFCGFAVGLIIMFFLAGYESILTNALNEEEYDFH